MTETMLAVIVNGEGQIESGAHVLARSGIVLARSNIAMGVSRKLELDC